MNRPRWTDDELDRLAGMLASGMTPLSISLILGRSVKAIWAMRHILMARRPGLAKALDRRIRELHGQGKSDGEIGRRVGLSKKSVAARREWMGLKIHSPHYVSAGHNAMAGRRPDPETLAANLRRYEERAGKGLPLFG